MSEQNNEFNSEIPPRQSPEPTIRNSGELVTMYHAQQGGGDSFPVLQAFQDYIEAERKQARKRVVQLSIGFAAILGVVVVGFLLAGVSMLKNMTSMQNKLVEVVAAKSQSPAPVQLQPAAAPAVPASPALEESIREMSRVLSRMQEAGGREPESIKPAVDAARAPEPEVVRPTTPDPAVEMLKAELLAVKEQNRKVAEQLEVMRRVEADAAKQRTSSRVVEEALALARKTAAEKAAADKAASEQAAAEAVRKEEEAERARLLRLEDEKALAVRMAAERIDEERKGLIATESAKPVVAQPVVRPVAESLVTVSKYPDPVKAPPMPRAGVLPQIVPQNMTAASLQLKMRNGERVPWRIFVPE